MWLECTSQQTTIQFTLHEDPAIVIQSFTAPWLHIPVNGKFACIEDTACLLYGDTTEGSDQSQPQKNLAFSTSRQPARQTDRQCSVDNDSED